MNRKVGWVAFAGVVAGYGIFRWLRSLDRGVRREIAAPLFPEEQGRHDHPEGGVPEERPPATMSAPAKAPAAGDGEISVAERILTAVRARPGVRQAELYALFPAESRRNLQELLSRLAREAVLTRQREGNTYRLYGTVTE